MKQLLLASLCASLLISTTAIAFAGPARFHAGVGVGAVAGLASGSQVEAAALNPTLHVDLGARLAPSASVYLRGEVGGTMLANQAAAYGVGEWQATRRLSLATGVGVDVMAEYAPDSSKNNVWAGVSVPLIVGYNLWHSGSHVGRLVLEGAAGMDAASVIGWHAGASVEWVWN